MFLKNSYLLILLCFFCAAGFSQPADTVPDYNFLKKNGLLTGKESFKNPSAVSTEFKITPSLNVDSTKCDCWKERDNTWDICPFNVSGGNGGPGLPPYFRNDDWSTGLVYLPFSFCLYDTVYNLCYINNNGNISFNNPYSTFTPTPFPDPNFIMVAPFWGDVDTRNLSTGLVYYKLTPTYLIVQWDSVGYFDSHASLLNTFQLIITNGSDNILPAGTNVSFCYKDMQWTTGDASMGNGGFGGAPASVGVNKGDGVKHIQFGLFDQPGNAWDGPGGNNDGVSWLDDQVINFSTCSNGNNVAPVLVSSLNACDTVTVCSADTFYYSAKFTAPELNQQVSAVINSTLPTGNLAVISSYSGVTAGITFKVSTLGLAPGLYQVNVTGTDNGTPNFGTTVKFYFRVLAPPVNLSITQNFSCSNSPNFSFTGPPGYVTYQWYDPSGNAITAAQTGNMQTLDLNAYINNCSSGNCQVNQNDTFLLIFGVNDCKATLNAIVLFTELDLSSFSISPSCLKAQDGSISLNIVNGGTLNYTWYTDSCTLLLPDTLSTLTNIYPGDYCVEVTSSLCPPFDTSFTVPVPTVSTQHISSSFPPCLNNSFYLVAGTDSVAAWYQAGVPVTGETNDSLLIYPQDVPDAYALVVYDSAGCKDSTVFTALLSDAEQYFLASYCPEDSLAHLYLPENLNFQNFQWYCHDSLVPDSLGGKNDSLLFSVPLQQIQNYFVMWDENGCRKIAFDFVAVIPGNLFRPDTTVNIFSPNNDGVNDLFYPFFDKKYSALEIAEQARNFSFSVYDRWGVLMYTCDYCKWGWNGYNNLREPVPDGTYYWIAEFESNCKTEEALTKKRGFVQVAR
jgi:gliding motility-associated-like protein